MPVEQLLLIVAGLLALSVLASKASSMLGVPSLVLFLAIGMLAGSEGIGGIYFDDAQLAQAVGVVAFIFILFSGGLDTSWVEVKPVWKHGLALATVGVLITALAVGLFATAVLGFSLLEGLLFGAVISSTDAAAVFSLMRMRSTRLAGNLEPLIELESGSNDPMAVFLTIGMISLLTTPGASVLSLVPMFVLQMSLGAALGLAIGFLGVRVMNRIRLQADGLYVVITIVIVLITYSATTLVGGNGFLAVYLCGLFMGNQDFIHKRSLSRFHDGLAWLMQIAMFLTLGLLVFPSQLLPLTGVALLSAAFLVFVARPAAVFLSLFWARMSPRELVLVSWVGLRGAAPIILATFPLVAGLPQAGVIFNLVFFVVLTSVLVQGTTVSLVANWLGLNLPEERRPPPTIRLIDGSRARPIDIRISATSPAVGKQIVDLHLPQGALIVLITRNGNHIVPTGSTVIEADDTLTLLASKEDAESARQQILKS
ncbi:MAG: potassium/proton antiporter [Anaerolineae bacterium]|nr:potassium/proton antiporter [Candidatus Roseilinea sp.]MDW8450990.1 potassium/proton antiporter [Anaerolineae bacterium]